MKSLTFTSPTSILAWANKSVGKRIGEAWYVQKDELFYYFGFYPEVHEYRLAFVSSKDIAGEQE